MYSFLEHPSQEAELISIISSCFCSTDGCTQNALTLIPYNGPTFKFSLAWKIFSQVIGKCPVIASLSTPTV